MEQNGREGVKIDGRRPFPTQGEGPPIPTAIQEANSSLISPDEKSHEGVTVVPPDKAVPLKVDLGAA